MQRRYWQCRCETADTYAVDAILGLTGRCSGTAEAAMAFERGRELLLADGWSSVGGGRSGARPPSVCVTEKLVGYFSKRTRRLNYRERFTSGRAIGSGAVEGQAKTLGLRLKSREARGCRAIVCPMARLVCVRNSVQWDDYRALAARPPPENRDAPCRSVRTQIGVPKLAGSDTTRIPPMK